MLCGVLATLVAAATWYVARLATDRPVEFLVAGVVWPASAWRNASVAMAFALKI